MALPVKAGKHAQAGESGHGSPEIAALVRSILGDEDPALRAIRERTEADGLPPINIGPDEGKILESLVRGCGAKRAVEIGALAGYSACWIARGLAAGGRLDTIEYEPRHAEVARRNLARAGFGKTAAVHVGAGLDVLKTLKGPYDFCFIDADKPSYPDYARWAAEHVRPGGVVVGDNAYFFGRLGEKTADAARMREFLAILADRERFSSCAMIPTGEGLAVAVRK